MTKIPVFEEIPFVQHLSENHIQFLKDLTKNDLEGEHQVTLSSTTENILKNYSLSLKPYLIDLTSLGSNAQTFILSIFERYFQAKQLSISFPYPTFFLTSERKYKHSLHTIQSLAQLPIFFMKKEEKLPKANLHSLQLNQIRAQRIFNHQLINTLEYIQADFREDSRSLYLLSQKIQFLKDLKSLYQTHTRKLKKHLGSH
jgi:hypothetical protein